MKHVGTIVIETQRLILRRLKKQDSLELFNGLRNQKEFLYYTNKKPVTFEEECQSLENIDLKYKNLDYYNWVIETKTGNVIVGMINLRVNEKNDSVEFNYATDNRYINKGYMTEALKEVIDFALNKINANRVQGGCSVKNHASRRVMEKCGLNYEGTLKKYLKLSDGYHDMHMFSITK